MATLKLTDLCKKWGGVTAVENFSLDIADNEFIVLLGPSGCGKTTTMRMIAGLEEPTSGDIFFGEKRVNKLEPRERDVAMVFQGYGLYPNMTVYENIRFPLKVRKTDKHLHDDKVRKAADRVALGALLDRKPKELSGGQRQRVALARAIVREPKVFLMDEPLSNLDAKLRISTRAEIKNLQHDLKVTTVYVTHDQVEAMTLADRVVVMNHGVIQQIGSPADIYNRPMNKFVAGFIGSPSMNLIDGEIKDGCFTAPGTEVRGLACRYEGKATLGFRPEDVAVRTAQGSAEEGSGSLVSKIYSLELLGDSTLVNIKTGQGLFSARADKELRAEIGTEVLFSIPPAKCAVFAIDPDGERIE